jgi:Tfp pilus assembly protein PilV
MSLIEAVMSTFVLALCVGGLFSGFNLGLKAAQKARRECEAEMRVVGLLEQLRAMPYAQVTNNVFAPEAVIATQQVHGVATAVPVWAMTTTVAHITTDGDYKEVRIDVTWAERNVVQQRTYYHIVSPGWKYAAYMAGLPGEYPEEWGDDKNDK